MNSDHSKTELSNLSNIKLRVSRLSGKTEVLLKRKINTRLDILVKTIHCSYFNKIEHLRNSVAYPEI